MGKGMARQKKSEHAQAALDFLMEYGWAIGLVVVIAAVLFTLGIFNPTAYLGSRAYGFSGVAAKGWYMASDGTFSIKIQNQAGVPIRIDTVEVTINNQTVNITGLGLRLERGQDSDVFYTPPGAFGTQNGGSYVVNVYIHYTDLNAGFPYASKGVVTGQVPFQAIIIGGNPNNQTNYTNQTNQTQKPDYTPVLYVAANGSNYTLNAPMTAYLTVKNLNATATASSAIATSGSSAVQSSWAAVPPISAGANYTAAGTVTCTQAGAISFTINVDSGNAISESNEGNNQMAVSGNCIAAANASNQTNATLITVIKHVINDNGGNKTAGNFQMRVNATNASLASFPGSESGTNVTLSAGAYNVTEDNVSGYASSLSSGCFGTILAGQSKTCTITNNDIASNQTQLSWCYQETATVPTACGGVSNSPGYLLTITYYLACYWHSGGAPTIDGNWSTYDYTTSGACNAQEMVNYTKPSSALGSSLWQVKDGNTIANITIPANCWNADPHILALRGVSDSYAHAVFWRCWDGSIWQILRLSAGSINVYEEGMWWQIQSG